MLVWTLSILFIGAANPCFAADWPQWQGPNRDGRSTETGLLRSWPEGGPALLATIDGLGRGFAQPCVVSGKIYTTGKVGEDLILFCFDVNGEKIWQLKVGPESNAQPSGSRSTPTIQGGRLYVLSGVGDLVAYDVATEESIWRVNVPERFGAKVPTYGYAESVLIDGDQLICAPGGPGAVVAALNKNTGETIWTTKGDEGEEGATYSSAIVFDYEGLRQISIMSHLALLGVAEEDGRLLWRYDRPRAEQNCSTPVFFTGYVFAATGYGTGGGAVKLTVRDGEVEAKQMWETKEMKAHHGGYVLVDGYIYGNNDSEGWTCIELATGKVTYKAKGVGKGSIAYADGMLYTLSENGKMGLAPANPLEHKIVGEFMIPNAGGETWAHPVIADGKLFLRRHEQIFIYDVKDRTKEVQ